GRSVVAGDETGALVICHLEDGSKRIAWDHHSDGIGSVDYSNDGQWIASGSWKGTVALWNPATGVIHRLEHPGAVMTVQFSSDDSLLLTATWDDRARLYRTSLAHTGTNSLVAETAKHGSLSYATLAPDGSFVVTASTWGWNALVWPVTVAGDGWSSELS